MKKEKRFEIFYKFLGWHCWSLGFHIDVVNYRIEIHIPSGWVGVGFYGDDKESYKPLSWEDGLTQIIYFKTK